MQSFLRHSFAFLCTILLFATESRADSPYGATSIGTTVNGNDMGAYHYDFAGNRLRNTAPGNLQTIGYGLIGKPVRITNNDGGIEAFRYAVGKQRYLRKHANDVDGEHTLKTLYIGDMEYRLKSDGSAKSIVYIRNGDYAPIAQVDATHPATPTYRYNLNDHQGSPLRTVNDASIAQDPQHFDPWGLTTSAEGVAVAPDDENRSYTGHEAIPSSGMLHMNGRVFEPSHAMFISPDPVVQQPYSLPNLNRYTLGHNSPVNGIDPSGNIFEILITSRSAENASANYGIDDLAVEALRRFNAMNAQSKGVLRALIRNNQTTRLYVRYNASRTLIDTKSRNTLNLRKLNESRFTDFLYLNVVSINNKKISFDHEEATRLIPLDANKFMFASENRGGLITGIDYHLRITEVPITAGMDLVRNQSIASGNSNAAAAATIHAAPTATATIHAAPTATAPADAAAAHSPAHALPHRESFDSTHTVETFGSNDFEARLFKKPRL